MAEILNGILLALEKIFSLDRELLNVSLLTCKVSGAATLISVVLGLPLGFVLSLTDFPGKRFVISTVNMGMGLPPVVVGLVVSLFLWRDGPLGFLELIYTPAAMVLAQAIIATPLVAAFTLAALQQVRDRYSLQVAALGATPWQEFWLLVREARRGILAAIIAGFGAVVSEVGASMMVGGNIKGETRVLTTAIVMEVSRGRFADAIALSLVLLFLLFAAVFLLTWLQQGGEGKR